MINCRDKACLVSALRDHMMDKFKDKYRISPIRMQKWNYGWDAAYFITICTKNKLCYFGEVSEGKMNLSNVGVLADVLWFEISNHARNVELGPFVVMPNHVHGVIVLKENNSFVTNKGENESRPDIPIGKTRFQSQGKNTVSSIIGSYKSAVTKHARRLGYDFFWQSRFYDHIIRNKQSYDKIAHYIFTNPEKWNLDTYYDSTP